MSSAREKNKKIAGKYEEGASVGNGTFGVILKATNKETGDVVAIKRVFQDRRYKNRELEIMKEVVHPNVVKMYDHYFTKGRGKDVYLNLVMEYIPDTIFHCIQSKERRGEHLHMDYVRCYAYQLTRSLAYIHRIGICHRDIKPQNVLLDPATHRVKLCDFGSAKKLAGETSIAYICSRYYRAPELIFEATKYSTQIDVWSLGCVVAEFFLGVPVFRGSSSLDQLVEIVKVLGAPTQEDIKAMNPSHTGKVRVPKVSKAKTVAGIFKNVKNGGTVTPLAIKCMEKWLQWKPKARPTCMQSLADPWFNEMRELSKKPLPDGVPYPVLYNWTEGEVNEAKKIGMWGENKCLRPSDK